MFASRVQTKLRRASAHPLLLKHELLRNPKPLPLLLPLHRLQCRSAAALWPHPAHRLQSMVERTHPASPSDENTRSDRKIKSRELLNESAQHPGWAGENSLCDHVFTIQTPSKHQSDAVFRIFCDIWHEDHGHTGSLGVSTVYPR